MFGPARWQAEVAIIAERYPPRHSQILARSGTSSKAGSFEMTGRARRRLSAATIRSWSSGIETGKSTPSPKTQEALRSALDPFEDPQRFVFAGGPLEAAESLRSIARRLALPYALTLDVATWLLTRYQTPSASWAYVWPLEEWVEEVLREGTTKASPMERGNLVLLRAPKEVLQGRREVEGFLLAPLRRVVEDGNRMGGRHALDAARLYLEFREARWPGLRLDPQAVIKVWEEAGPWT